VIAVLGELRDGGLQDAGLGAFGVARAWLFASAVPDLPVVFQYSGPSVLELSRIQPRPGGHRGSPALARSLQVTATRPRPGAP
jgi:hypothetical protein